MVWIEFNSYWTHILCHVLGCFLRVLKLQRCRFNGTIWRERETHTHKLYTLLPQRSSTWVFVLDCRQTERFRMRLHRVWENDRPGIHTDCRNETHLGSSHTLVEPSGEPQGTFKCPIYVPIEGSLFLMVLIVWHLRNPTWHFRTLTGHLLSVNWTK